MERTKLTKKEINENLTAHSKGGFGNGFYYEGTIRGFRFETEKDDIIEIDDTGHCTYVCPAKNKPQIIDDLFEWFKQYASDVFDLI